MIGFSNKLQRGEYIKSKKYFLREIYKLNLSKSVTYFKTSKICQRFYKTSVISCFHINYKKRANGSKYFLALPILPTFGTILKLGTILKFGTIPTFSANKDSYKNTNKKIRLIENEADCEKAIEEINKNKIVAMDFEGTNLGRYGKICIMQIYTQEANFQNSSNFQNIPNYQNIPNLQNPKDLNREFVENYYIFDLMKTSVQKNIYKIIECKKTVKVIHDCREDSSALYNQLGLKLQNVYDLSRAHMLILEKERKGDIYQIGFCQLLKDYLGIEDDTVNNLKKSMYKNEKIWEMRPLNKTSIIYALKNVKYLIPLYKIFQRMLPENEVLKKSEDFVNYCFLNNHYKLPVDLAKRGNVIEAMLVSKTMLNCVFKLNSTRKGIACTPSSVAQFRDVQVGDVTLCVVSNKSIDQKILYLCKYDDVYDYWNLKERPRGKFKPSIHENNMDPLINSCENEYNVF